MKLIQTETHILRRWRSDLKDQSMPFGPCQIDHAINMIHIYIKELKELNTWLPANLPVGEYYYIDVLDSISKLFRIFIKQENRLAALEVLELIEIQAKRMLANQLQN